jgi:hypothetical protein
MSKFIFTSLFFLLGCTSAKQLPDDFELSFSDSPAQPGAGGGHRISITKDSVESGYFLTIVSDTITRQAVSLTQIQALYETIIRDRVFILKSRYEDMNILDGGTTSIYIRANRKEKKIQLRNTIPNELSGLFTAVNTIITSSK